MSKALKNKKVLVTGGSRGIGAALVGAFQKEEALVTYTGQSLTPSTVIEGARYLSLDLANDNSIHQFFKTTENESFDVVINNAGINKINNFTEIDIKDFQKIQKVNLEGPFLISQKFISKMEKNNFGRIVNIASIFSSVTKEKRASYSSSKFGLVGMTKAMAVEYASKNVLVNVVSPGFIDTELTRKILTPSQIDELTSLVPMKRLGLAQEIAKVVVFLSSPDNTFITGQNIIADGGFTCV